MQNYRYLNLPANPLKNREDFLEHLNQNPIMGGYNIYDSRILNDEVIEAFAKIGLKVGMIAVFGRNDSDCTINDRLIHTDCALTKDGTYKKLCAGVNWEIHENENEFSWWDMSAINECWPEENITIRKYQYLNGIHYGKRLQMGIPEGAICLEKGIVSGPTLVRTDLPHLVMYKSGPAKRVSLSIRFHPEFESWEQAVEAFKPITK